jgi:D-alanyl-D-alanine carboxypeptidase
MLFVSVACAEAATAPLARVQAGIERMSAAGTFSGVVVVAKNGVVVFAQAYGLADRARNVPNRIDTEFNLASMGKMFTGVAVAQLVQQRTLRFSDVVGRYIPGLPARIGKRVTVGELLDHTSGLGDYFQDPGYDRLRGSLTSLHRYLPLIERERPAFTPGARFSYSNSGFILAGLIIEHVSGESYYDYLRRHVWLPSGMHRTGCFLARAALPRGRAIGYTVTGVPNTSGLPPRGTSAGGCYSTAGDLVRFANALVHHRLLDRALTREVTSSHVRAPGGGYGYGFGDRRSRAGAPPTIWHNGGAPGVAGELDIDSRLGVTVAVLENRDPTALRSTMQLILGTLHIL